MTIKLIGIETAGGTTIDTWAGYKIFARFTADSSGQLSSIKVKVDGTSVTAKVAIYANGTNTPTTLLGVHNTAAVLTDDTYTEIALDSAVHITASTDYWLAAAIICASTAKPYYDGTVTNDYSKYADNTNDFADDPSVTGWTYTWCLNGYGLGPASYNDTVTDGIKVGDTPSTQWNVQTSVTDGAKIGDAPVTNWNIQSSLTDGFKIGDSLTGTTVTFNLTQTDGLVLTDTPATQVDFNPTVTDGAKIGDTPATQMSMIVNVADGIKLGDVPVAKCNFYNAISDGFKIGDAATVFVTFNVALTDGVKVGDAVSALMDWMPTVTDGFTIGDTLVIIRTGKISVTIALHSRSLTLALNSRSLTLPIRSRTLTIPLKIN